MTAKITLTPDEIMQLIRQFKVTMLDEQGRLLIDKDALLAEIAKNERPIPFALLGMDNVSKNWVRLCAAVDGFHQKHGRWPTRVRLSRSVEDELRHSLSREQFENLSARLTLNYGDRIEMVAEDDDGSVYDYRREGIPRSRSNPSAERWLTTRG